jgi:hypothetical protein
VIADIPQVLWQSPIAFVVGAFVGFVISDRYRIVRRNGKEEA